MAETPDPDEIMKRMKDGARAEEIAEREADDYELRVQAAERKIRSRRPFLGSTNVSSYEHYGVGDPRLEREMVDLQVSGVDVSPFGPSSDQTKIKRRSSQSKIGKTGRDYEFPARGRMPAATVTTPHLYEMSTEVRDESGREIPALNRMYVVQDFRDALQKARAELGPMQSYAPEFEEALFRVMREQALRLKIPDAELAQSVDELDKIAKASVLGVEGAGQSLPISRLKGTEADYRRRD